VALTDSHHAHRRMFGHAYGEGPFDCHFCGEQIIEMSGRSTGSFTVHHVNGDHGDNRSDNLVASHKGCHQTHHHKGKKGFAREWTEDQKARVSASLKGRSRPPEVRAKIAESHRKRRERAA